MEVHWGHIQEAVSVQKNLAQVIAIATERPVVLTVLTVNGNGTSSLFLRVQGPKQ